MSMEKAKELVAEASDQLETAMGILQRMARDPPWLEGIARNFEKIRAAVRLAVFILETLDGEARKKWQELQTLLEPSQRPDKFGPA